MMKWTVKLVGEVVSGNPIEHEIATIERAEEISPASVGLTIAEGKALLQVCKRRLLHRRLSSMWPGSGLVLIAERHCGRRAIISPPSALFTVASACVSGE